MALPTEVPMPSYIIYRDTAPDRPMDPTAPLVFWPEKDSDELFDALRAKYPLLRAHSERMREAVIEFLMEERQLSDVQTEQLPTPQTAHSNLTSPWQASMPSMTSESSTWSSPELFDLATPTFGNSPQPQLPQLSRQVSTATTATAPGTQSPPALEHMTGVFSLSDVAQPKQRVRRKMTEAEKVEYRKRRIVKACDKCAKRKRKCQHNQPEMDIVGPTKSDKVTKPNTTPTFRKPPSAPDLPQIHEYDAIFGAETMDFGDSFGSDVPMSQPLEYSSFLEEDLNFDDLLASTESQWPWSDTQDWTLMDTGSTEFATTDLTHKNQIKQEQNIPQYQSGTCNDVSDSSGGMVNPRLMQLPGSEDYNDSNCMLWEHLRTGQVEKPQEKQQPTHTAHVHDAEGQDMFSFDQTLWPSDGSEWTDSQIYDADVKQTTSLAQMTLRLTGTRKAVQAFGNLLQSSPSRRSSLRATSLRKVATIALAGLSMAQPQLAGPERTGQLSWGRSLSTIQQCDACSGTFRFSKDLNRHMQTTHHLQPFAGREATGLLDGMSMQDYLRMQTNKSPVEEDGRAGVSLTPQQREWPVKIGVGKVPVNATNATTSTQTNATSKGLGKHPMPCSDGVEVPRHLDSNAQQGRQMPSSLGEGIATCKSPSTELFMLKRRIPKALHSVVAVNSPSAALGPLLTSISEGVPAQTPITGLGHLANVDAPSLTRSRKHPTPHAGDNTDQFLSSSSSGITSNLLTDAWNARGPATADVFAKAGGLVAANSPASVVWKDRLSDHMRRRDHFGRHSIFSGALEKTIVSSVALIALLALLLLVPTNTTNLSLLLLALASPVSGAKGMHQPRSTHFASQVWGTIVQCTLKNSSWLAGIDGSVQNHAPARTFLQRLLYSGSKQDNGTSVQYKASTRGLEGRGKKDGSYAVVAVIRRCFSWLRR